MMSSWRRLWSRQRGSSMVRTPKTACLVILLASFLPDATAAAAPLLVSQGVARDGYGLIRWENMTALLDTAADGQVQVTTPLDNFEFMLGFDALWVDQRGI